jgi:hypothetical protein
MVIKGSARGGAASLAQHLQRMDTNERMEVRELRGVMAEDLDKALQEMEAVASGARSARHFYHASINTRADEVMTPQQWQQAVDRLERELDLSDQPRAVVAHVKEGRAHVHVVWSRIDLETMKAIPDSHNYRRHELVARELEKEFGHAHVQGAHIGREGERPERTPSHAEMQQAERTGIDPKEAKAQLTEIWNRTDSGRAFVAAIEEQGWTLARGDRRDFVLVDQAGEVHSLARRIEGVRAKDIRDRMAHIHLATLPTAEQAKEMQRERQEAHGAPAPEIAAPQLASPAPEVRQAPAQPTQQAAKPMPAQPTPRAPTGAAPQITPRAEALDKLAQADKADQKALRTDTARAFGDAGRQAAQDARQERQEESARREQAAWRQQVTHRAPEKAQPVDKGLKVINAATGMVSKLGDFVLGLLGGSSAPAEPAPNMRSFVTDPAARKAQQLARLEAKRQEQAAERALERMYDDMREGKALSSADIQNLTHEHLRTISAHGDDGGVG